MEETVSVILDFSKCKYISEIYHEMRAKMKWEDWYGPNLDALWDILTGLPYYGNDFTIIRPYVYRNIPHEQDKLFTEYMDKLCTVFLRAERMYGEITVRIEYLS